MRGNVARTLFPSILSSKREERDSFFPLPPRNGKETGMSALSLSLPFLPAGEGKGEKREGKRRVERGTSRPPGAVMKKRLKEKNEGSGAAFCVSCQLRRERGRDQFLNSCFK